jgi:hypothetical protein
MKTPPNMFLLLHLTLLFLSSIYFSKSNADIDFFCNESDEATLLKIRDHFGGPEGPLNDWDSNTHCCYWSFVGCGKPYPGRITGVTIGRGMGLSGTLPAEFGDLPYLDFLSLAEMPKVTGPIPNSFSKLKRLTNLDLGSNSLSGPIPSFLGKLKRLKEVDLSNNKLSGAIPASLDNLQSLSQFNVSFNQLCGAIPTGLSKFAKSSFDHNKCLCDAPLAPCKGGIASSK